MALVDCLYLCYDLVELESCSYDLVELERSVQGPPIAM